jgi:hypothetical protein
MIVDVLVSLVKKLKDENKIKTTINLMWTAKAVPYLTELIDETGLPAYYIGCVTESEIGN